MISRHKMLVAALFILALIAVPFTRNVLRFQVIMGVRPTAMGQGWIRSEENRTVARDAEDALVIAKREAFKAKSINAYWNVIEQFPNEPALYANLLRYSMMSWGPLNKNTRGASIPRGIPWKPLQDSPELRKVAQAIEIGKKLEPDNAYFDYFEATLRFDQGRDSEALAAIHRAAAKGAFDDHVWDEFDAEVRDRHERTPEPMDWLSPVGRVALACAVIFPNYYHFRGAARVAGGHIEQDMRQGRHDRALATTTDLVRVGGVIRDRCQVAIGVLTGIAIQNIAVGHAYRGLGGPKLDPDLTSVERLDRLQALAANDLRPGEWRALRDNLARSEEFRTRMKRFAGRDWTRMQKPIMVSAILMSVTGVLLLLIVMLALAWGIACAWLAKRKQADVTGVGPSRLSTLLLALLPTLAVLVLMSFLQMASLFGLSPPMEGLPFTAAIGVIILLSPLGVIILAAAGTRIAPEVGRFTTFLARLRAGSVYALQALVVLYLLGMMAAIPATAKANRAADGFFRNEVQQIWEYQPPE